MKKIKNNNDIWTSANIVTIIRILLVPVFVVVLISPWPSWLNLNQSFNIYKPWIALGIFILLSVTDSLDGYLARSKNQITDFGKFMDPLADKILVFAALISLVELSVLPSWVVLVMLIREFIVSGIRMLAASKGVVIAASWYGKAKTVTQLLAIILFIVKESLSSSGAQNIADPLYIIAWIVMIVALVLTVISMIDYIYNARFLFYENIDESEDLASNIIKVAGKNKKTIACAESLTGGLISSTITAVPGSSNVLKGSIVSYMYEIKSKLLSVNKNLLKTKGAVNEECAKQMAKGAKDSINVDIAISATGIAGPSKDEFDTPVGTVFIGLATENEENVFKFNFSGNREQIRNKTVIEALKILTNSL